MLGHCQRRVLLRVFLWWNLEGEATSPRRLGIRQEHGNCPILCTWGTCRDCHSMCQPREESATVWNYIHTNVKTASHVFNYSFTFSSCQSLPESYQSSWELLTYKQRRVLPIQRPLHSSLCFRTLVSWKIQLTTDLIWTTSVTAHLSTKGKKRFKENPHLLY